MNIHTHKIWTTTYCCMRNELIFFFLIWLNFKSIPGSSTHSLNAVGKLKRQQEIRVSQCKRTTNCLALHLQLKYKCPIKGFFQFPFACASMGGGGGNNKKKKKNQYLLGTSEMDSNAITAPIPKGYKIYEVILELISSDIKLLYEEQNGLE